jgi:hypothetical protein
MSNSETRAVAQPVFASRTARLPTNIDDWPVPPFKDSTDYRDWRERDEAFLGRRRGPFSPRSHGRVGIEAGIISAAKNHRWEPRWWEDEEWARRKILYGGAEGRRYGEWLLNALKNPPDVFHVLVVEHRIFKDAVGELPHDVRLAPGDQVSIVGTPYNWHGRASLAFVPTNLVLLSSDYELPRSLIVRRLSDSDETPRHYHQIKLYDLFGSDWLKLIASDSQRLDHPELSRWKDRTKQRIFEVCSLLAAGA